MKSGFAITIVLLLCGTIGTLISFFYIIYKKKEEDAYSAQYREITRLIEDQLIQLKNNWHKRVEREYEIEKITLLIEKYKRDYMMLPQSDTVAPGSPKERQEFLIHTFLSYAHGLFQNADIIRYKSLDGTYATLQSFITMCDPERNITAWQHYLPEPVKKSEPET